MRRLLPLLLLVPTLTFAQEKFQEKLTVTYVEIPVTVLGRGNVPVRGLTRANFEIRDSGEVRAVESFDIIDFARTAPAQKVISPLNPASRRNFLLLFDLSFSSPISVSRAQDAARNFVARSIGRRDLVGVATIDVSHGVRFLTSFTTDRNMLNAAVRDPRHFRGNDPLQLAFLRGTGLEDTAGGQGQQPADERDAMAREMAADIARGVVRADDAYRRGRVKQQVEMLAQVARSLNKLAGRKHIVLLSEGFDPRLVQGRVAGDIREQSEENMAALGGEIWKIDSDKRFGNAATQKSISDMAEQFRRADVVLHSVDIQGVRVQNEVQTGSRVNSNEGLFLLANSTGGTVFRNSNDISSEFDRLARQHEVVYVLGFQAPSGRAGEFHDLKVKLVDVPGARVQHRGGYYSGGNESLVERTLSTAEVIVNDIPQTDIDLAAIATPFPAGSGKSQVPVILEIEGIDLVKHARGGVATVEIFSYAFDEEGIVRDSLFQRMRLDMKQTAERLREGGIKFYGTLSLGEGRYAIKNLVRVAESEAKGYQRINVTVPSPDDVAVSQPMFFEEPRAWVMVKGASSDAAGAPYPFVLDGQSFIPAARANLRKGEPRLFTVWVYNAQPDELTVEVAPEAKLVSSKPDADVTKYVFALEGVPAGARELGVTIRKKGSSDERRATVPIFPR